MSKFFSLPMVLLLSIKYGFMGIFLKMAHEQTRDAAALACPKCLHSESGCMNSHSCRLHRFKDREEMILREICDIRRRVSRLRGR